jgi:hypothetical protein
LAFGLLAGAINTVMVGRYGFVTSDTAIDGAIAAFYFGIIALGAIGGPAVAVHFVAKQRWVWGAMFGFIAAVSLCANVVNSLGALASRSDKTQAERVRARDDAKDDRGHLARIMSERAGMVFVPATEESVQAAREAVTSAEAIRLRECGNGDPRQRGPRCRERETEEQAKRDALATALANKALTDKATKLDNNVATIRARLDKAPPVQSVDPLADAIGKLVHLPSEVAAAWQKASVVVVVELLIACALVAFELLGNEPDAPRKIETAAAPQERRDNVLPMVPPKASIASDEHVARFMLDCLPRSIGDEVTWVDAFERYQRWCGEQTPRITPLNPEMFGRELKALCKRAGIRTRAKGRDVYCVNVKLDEAA